MSTALDPETRAAWRPVGWLQDVRRRFRDIRVVAIAVGVAGALVSFAGSWIPSFWGDEAASIMSAQRSLPSLFGMLFYIDAVHGAYYVFLHGWIGLFGASELSVRLPSAIGVGVAAAGVVILGHQMLSRRIGILAGVIFSVLPRVTAVGTEARSSALAIAVAVWVTVLLVSVLNRDTAGRRSWLAYSISLAAGIYLFLYLALLVVVHGVLVLSWNRSGAVVRRWLRAVAIAAAIALPVIVWGVAQRRQIAFLGERYDIGFRRVFIQPWFTGSRLLDGWTSTLWLSAVCWALILIGAGWLLWLNRPQSSPTGADALARPRAATGLLLAWLILPGAMLLAGTALLTPMFSTRYLAFCTPAVALLIATGISVLRRSWLQASVVAVLIALVVPGYIDQRGPFAMDGSDWRQLSAVVGQEARPGDAIIFGEASRPSRMPRLAMRLYPDDYRGLRDVELVTPYHRLPQLFDRVAELETVDARLADATTVWAVAPLPDEASAVPADVASLQRLGFGLVQEVPFHRNGVYELTRAPAGG